jgi:integrase
LQRNVPTNEALFPAIRDVRQGGDGYLSLNSVTTIRNEVMKDICVRLDIRMTRRTFGQKCIDDGMSIETTSVLMGHETTLITERRYARKKNEAALIEARNVGKAPETTQTRRILSGANTPSIDFRNEMISYA